MKLLRFRAPVGVQSICGFDSLDDFVRASTIDILKTFYRGTYRYCKHLLLQKHLLDAIKQHNFDVAIFDAVDQCSKILADYIDIPFIVFHTSGIECILPRNPAFLPSMLTRFTDDMSLGERTLNTLGWVVQQLIVYHTYNYYQGLREELHFNASLNVYDSFNRASLRFILGEWGLDYVGPTQPSHILLGGVIQAQDAPLPSHLQTFLERSSASGVVVLSFGSIAREFGPRYRLLFAEALARLPYNVIWRYDEAEIPSNLGNNTMLLPWIPQSKLLSDPRVRVFITHCGMNAALETARAGVPVVGIPLFADQFFQASKLIQHVKMGELLDIHSLQADQLYTTIMRVAQSDTYRRNAQRISAVLRDRPFEQDEQIRRWTNYVVRHHGARHLSCKGFDLAWYQYYLLDVTAILVTLSLVTSCVLFYFLKQLFLFAKRKYADFVRTAATLGACLNNNISYSQTKPASTPVSAEQSDYVTESKALQVLRTPDGGPLLLLADMGGVKR